VFRRLVLRVVQLVAGKLAEMYGARGQKLDIVSLKDMPKDFEGLHEWAPAA